MTTITDDVVKAPKVDSAKKSDNTTDGGSRESKYEQKLFKYEVNRAFNRTGSNKNSFEDLEDLDDDDDDDDDEFSAMDNKNEIAGCSSKARRDAD